MASAVEQHKTFCRYGPECLKKDDGCMYDHVQKPCKDGKECHKKHCGYAHPEGRQLQPKSKQPCHHGFECIHPNCKFEHPEGFVPQKHQARHAREEHHQPKAEHRNKYNDPPRRSHQHQSSSVVQVPPSQVVPVPPSQVIQGYPGFDPYFQIVDPYTIIVKYRPCLQ